MKLALKIDVDTYRGTRDAVPQMIKMLARHQAQATFLFSLGPDHTGRAIRRVFRPGFVKKVSRTSVVSHYGVNTMLYGTLLPGPDIGRRCAEVMRRVRDEGFEVGIHAYDHVEWQDRISSAGPEWTEREMRRACDRFQEIFSEPARTHGAAGWQMNIHAYRLAQQLGFRYCSDTRGTRPFIPVCDSEIIACPQLPTTLPTLDELIGRDGVTVDNVSRRLLGLTEKPTPSGHVYTLHAELEGNRLAAIFEELLAGWQSQGYSLVSLRDYAEGQDISRLPRHVVTDGTIPGRSGTVALQGEEILN
ncbi:MAG: polysaccharide deacetylase family protein [Nitrospiraceae bacterium]